ncbi:hypothetical protein G9A89_015676 [Geosiphon pyriformis]|nr:hypothetical protein G9A89_015676 [Geosiphon pyriformis]
MTDFGLTDGYQVHDSLDQGEVFSSLLWHIFYDSFLCKVKHQENVYRYRLNFHFVSGSGRIESQTGLFSFFTVEVFVNDTIWVNSSQAVTQHILDIASKFFQINNISINNNKTVAILINSKVSTLSLFISGSPIFVAYREESHWYLGIFLSTEGFSKPSLAKTHLDVHFFINLVLKKAVLDKQFLYLVLVVLYPIVSYRMQFSFVPIDVCNKWDALIHKGLKLKSGLLLDFPDNIIHYLFFYGLKSFLQCQFESKVALLISFANSKGILSRLFSHRFHDLQVLYWCPIYPLSSPAHIRVSAFNNFLSDMVYILLDCNLSLDSPLADSFQLYDGIPISTVLGKSLFCKFLPSLWCYDIVFVDQLHDHHGDVFD